MGNRVKNSRNFMKVALSSFLLLKEIQTIPNYQQRHVISTQSTKKVDHESKCTVYFITFNLFGCSDKEVNSYRMLCLWSLRWLTFVGIHHFLCKITCVPENRIMSGTKKHELNAFIASFRTFPGSSYPVLCKYLGFEWLRRL